MSIYGSIMAASTTVSDLRNPALWLKQVFAARTKAGEAVSEDSALGLAGYYAAIRAISEDIGKLPLFTYKRLKRGKDKATDHPVYDLLKDAPNHMMEAMCFRETLQHWALGWGNGYAEIEFSGDVPIALWPIHPSRVVVRQLQASKELQYEVKNDDGEVALFPQHQMFHLKGLGNVGIVGYSIARIAAESIGLGLATETFGNNFFGNGTHMSGVLKTPHRVKKEQHENLRAEWMDMYAGPENAMKPAILEQGMEWQRLGIEPEAAQFLQTRYFTIEEMSRWFRITPHKLQHLLRSTFNNIESLNIQYVTDTLQPWMVRWEQQIKRKLLGRPADKEFFSEHQVLGLLRGDIKTRSDYYNRRFHIGTLSQNDIRELENENPIDDGDTYYVPMNMQRSEDASAEPEPTPIPAVTPAAPEGDEEEATRRREESENEPEEARGVSPRLARAFLPVFEDAFSRAHSREEKAVARAAKRHKEDVEGFLEWCNKFYVEQFAFSQKATEPGKISVCTALGRDNVPGYFETLSIVENKSVAIESFKSDPLTVGDRIAAFNKGRDRHLAVRMLKELTNGTRC